MVSPSIKEDSGCSCYLHTGSEVNLAVAAQEALEGKELHAAVVSMPSWDRFEAQSKEYKETCHYLKM